jgi:hypothetical protein
VILDFDLHVHILDSNTLDVERQGV